MITKQWEKREKQIDRVMLSMVEVDGDLQAIAWTTLQGIEGFDVRLLEQGEPVGKGIE